MPINGSIMWYVPAWSYLVSQFMKRNLVRCLGSVTRDLAWLVMFFIVPLSHSFWTTQEPAAKRRSTTSDWLASGRWALLIFAPLPCWLPVACCCDQWSLPSPFYIQVFLASVHLHASVLVVDESSHELLLSLWNNGQSGWNCDRGINRCCLVTVARLTKTLSLPLSMLHERFLCSGTVAEPICPVCQPLHCIRIVYVGLDEDELEVYGSSLNAESTDLPYVFEVRLSWSQNLSSDPCLWRLGSVSVVAASIRIVNMARVHSG